MLPISTHTHIMSPSSDPYLDIGEVRLRLSYASLNIDHFKLQHLPDYYCKLLAKWSISCCSLYNFSSLWTVLHHFHHKIYRKGKGI